MQLHVICDSKYQEVEITIRCDTVDKRLKELITQIQCYGMTISARREGSSYALNLDSIYYIESVEDKTFVYQRDQVFECKLRLYELEIQLVKTALLRVSKGCILNVSIVDSVRPMLGGRLEALLQNGEKIIINRHYVPAFKSKFGLEDSI